MNTSGNRSYGDSYEKHIAISAPLISDNFNASHTTVLSVENITKSFGKCSALEGISLNVNRGEIVGLLGPDGAGKTVTFFAILGLMKVNSGKVLLDGKDVTHLPLDQRALRGLGYLPQEPSIFRGQPVSQNIMMELELFERDPSRRKRKLDKLLTEFHINYVRNTPARALSGGERRRCEIARAMAADPMIILLDEPFAGIDPMSIRDIRAMIGDLKGRNIGVLLTDQNVHELFDLLDRVYVIHQGRIAFHGSVDEMVHDPAVRHFYLGEEFA